MQSERLIPISLSALFLWGALSLLWSEVPSIGLRRLVLTFVVALIIFQLTAVAKPHLVIARLRQAILLLGIASFIVIMVLPSIGIHQPNDIEVAIIGDWRGVFYHKNIFGAVLAPGILITTYMFLLSKGRQRQIYLLQSAFLCTLLLMSASKTSIGILVVSGLSLAALVKLAPHRMGKQYLSLVATSVIILTIIGTIYYISDSSYYNIFDEDSFTGRGLIWTRLIAMAQDHFWLGFGFQSIFQVGENSPLIDYFDGAAFLLIISHSHNLYLEMLISIGAIGLGIFLLAIIVVPIREVTQADNSFSDIRFLCFSIMLFTWLHGIFEVGIFDRDRIDWIFFLVAYGVLQRIPKAHSA